MPNTRRVQQLPRTPFSESSSSPASIPNGGVLNGLVSHNLGIALSDSHLFLNNLICLLFRMEVMFALQR